jgi:hypothetical protein
MAPSWIVELFDVSGEVCGCVQVKPDAMLTSLRGEPRYKAFLRKMNLPE